MKFRRVLMTLIYCLIFTRILSLKSYAEASTTSISFGYKESAPQYQKELRIIKVEPTVLFKNEKAVLTQAVDITIDNKGKSVNATLAILISSDRLSFDIRVVTPGNGVYRFFIPEILDSILVNLELKSNGKIQDTTSLNWIPRKHWEICLVPIAHHDNGYTGTIEQVRQTYKEIYEDVLRFCEQTDSYPDEAKFRYTAEASWSIKHFIEDSDKSTVDKLGKYIQQGRIEVPAFFGNEISGLCSHEEQIRLLYPSAQICRELGGKVNVGGMSDTPGISWGLPTVLAGAGIKYFFAGMPNYLDGAALISIVFGMKKK